MDPALATLIYITAFTRISLFSSSHSIRKSTIKSPIIQFELTTQLKNTLQTTQPPKCLPNLRSSSSSLPTTRWATQESPLGGTWCVLPFLFHCPIPSNRPFSLLALSSHLQTTTNTLFPSPNSPTPTTSSHHTPKSASPLPPAAPRPLILPQSKPRKKTMCP